MVPPVRMKVWIGVKSVGKLPVSYCYCIKEESNFFLCKEGILLLLFIASGVNRHPLIGDVTGIWLDGRDNLSFINQS